MNANNIASVIISVGTNLFLIGIIKGSIENQCIHLLLIGFGCMVLTSTYGIYRMVGDDEGH